MSGSVFRSITTNVTCNQLFRELCFIHNIRHLLHELENNSFAEWVGWGYLALYLVIFVTAPLSVSQCIIVKRCIGSF